MNRVVSLGPHIETSGDFAGSACVRVILDDVPQTKHTPEATAAVIRHVWESFAPARPRLLPPEGELYDQPGYDRDARDLRVLLVCRRVRGNGDLVQTLRSAGANVSIDCAGIDGLPEVCPHRLIVRMGDRPQRWAGGVDPDPCWGDELHAVYRPGREDRLRHLLRLRFCSFRLDAGRHRAAASRFCLRHPRWRLMIEPPDPNPPPKAAMRLPASVLLPFLAPRDAGRRGLRAAG